MMSRITIITVLAVASLLCSSGAAFGASALSTDTNSSAAQYGNPTRQVLDDQSGGAAKPAAAKPAAQAPRQLKASGASLPFTGLAVIPIVLIGLALLSVGMLLRRRSATPRSLQ